MECELLSEKNPNYHRNNKFKIFYVIDVTRNLLNLIFLSIIVLLCKD